MAKVLVVDDEKLIVKGIRFSLEQDGFEVACAYDGEEALQMAKETEYDMVLLDVMLPKLNGFEVCQAIREFSEMPIIMLTAKGDDMDKILGLEYGADDYITKPFNILEVKARIKAILRRNSKKSRQEPQQTKKVIEAGDLTLDSDSRRVFIASREINLTAKEFDLRSQIDLAGGDKDPAAVRIQRQIARLDDFLCLLRLLSRFLGVAAQDRLDARLYFQNVKWLCDIIIGAVFQPQNLIHIVAFCGQHNDRHLGELPDCLADFKSVQLRQHHVQKNHIILRLLCHLKRFLPVIGAGNFKSILFQTETDSFYY